MEEEEGEQEQEEKDQEGSLIWTHLFAKEMQWFSSAHWVYLDLTETFRQQQKRKKISLYIYIYTYITKLDKMSKWNTAIDKYDHYLMIPQALRV